MRGEYASNLYTPAVFHLTLSIPNKLVLCRNIVMKIHVIILTCPIVMLVCFLLATRMCVITNLPPWTRMWPLRANTEVNT